MKKSILDIVESLFTIFIIMPLSAILAGGGAILALGIFMAILSNMCGLLFGFEYVSDACRDYRNHSQPRLEKYALPISPYACKIDGGLLQPAVSQTFEWLGERVK